MSQDLEATTRSSVKMPRSNSTAVSPAKSAEAGLNIRQVASSPKKFIRSACSVDYPLWRANYLNQESNELLSFTKAELLATDWEVSDNFRMGDTQIG